MQRIFWLLLIVSVMSGCAAVANPELAANPKASDRMLLADRRAIDKGCWDAQSVDISCEFAKPESNDASNARDRLRLLETPCPSWLFPIPLDRMNLLDWAFHSLYCAKVVIYRQTDDAGTEYYMARPVVLRSSNGPKTFTSGNEDIVWAAFSKFVANAPLGSTLADDYMKVARARHEAAEAQAAYLESDEYKRAQNNAAIESCRKTISYARGLIEDDNRVARISGYHNKHLREQAALMIVRCEDVIAQASGKR